MVCASNHVTHLQTDRQSGNSPARLEVLTAVLVKIQVSVKLRYDARCIGPKVSKNDSAFIFRDKQQKYPAVHLKIKVQRSLET
jgi:hypothetical protein